MIQPEPVSPISQARFLHRLSGHFIFRIIPPPLPKIHLLLSPRTDMEQGNLTGVWSYLCLVPFYRLCIIGFLLWCLCIRTACAVHTNHPQSLCSSQPPRILLCSLRAHPSHTPAHNHRASKCHPLTAHTGHCFPVNLAAGTSFREAR